MRSLLKVCSVINEITAQITIRKAGDNTFPVIFLSNSLITGIKEPEITEIPNAIPMVVTRQFSEA